MAALSSPLSRPVHRRRLARGRQAIGALAIALALGAVALAGCQQRTDGAGGGDESAQAVKGGKGAKEKARVYSGDAAGLKALFEDILEAAQKDNRERVHDLLAPLVMDEAELRAILGEEEGRRLWPRYRKMTETLIHRGAVELVAQVYDRKLDDVEVIEVDPKGSLRNEDRAVLDSLKEPLTIYSVRLKRKTDDLGLRYDFFFHRGGKWRTGNLLGRILAEQGPALPPPAPVRRDGGG